MWVLGGGRIVLSGAIMGVDIFITVEQYGNLPALYFKKYILAYIYMFLVIAYISFTLFYLEFCTISECLKTLYQVQYLCLFNYKTCIINAYYGILYPTLF